MVKVVFDGGNWSGVKVYENGVDISRNCQDITISPGRSATVSRLAVNEQGKHYIDVFTGDLARGSTLSIDKISGSWTKQSTSFNTTSNGVILKKVVGFGAETPWLYV